MRRHDDGGRKEETNCEWSVIKWHMEEAAPWVVWRGWTRRLGVEESGHAGPGSYGEQITCPVTELKIRNLLDGAHDRPASIFYLLGQPRGHKVTLYLSGSEL